MSAPALPARPAEEADPDQALEVFLTERPRLLGLAHRMLRDSAEAEDVLQEVWIRWQRTDRQAVKNPAAFLTTATTRLSINVIQSARHRHEQLSEVPAAAVRVAFDASQGAEQAAAVRAQLATLMAKLTSAELVAYLLRKCFDYPYERVARLLGTSTVNARQLVSRSQTAIVAREPHRVDLTVVARLADAFVSAVVTGELAALESLLSAGMTSRRTTLAA